MPIRVICEKRHHLGEADLSYPAIFCEACGERISVAKDGNMIWQPIHSSEQDLYDAKNEPVFTHKACYLKLLGAAKKGIIHVETPFGKLTVQDVIGTGCSSMELAHAVRFLSANLGL